MSAEVFEEVGFRAECDDCDWASELVETNREAEREAEAHDVRCGGEDHDPRTEREKWQATLDDARDKVLESLR